MQSRTVTGVCAIIIIVEAITLFFVGLEGGQPKLNGGALMLASVIMTLWGSGFLIATGQKDDWKAYGDAYFAVALAVSISVLSALVFLSPESLSILRN